MAEEQQKKESELEKWRKRCCYCCAFGVLLGMMLLVAGDNKTEEGKTPGEYESVEDCLDELFGNNSTIQGNCHYTGPGFSSSNCCTDNNRQRIDTAVRYFSSKGLNKAQIAGILGNWLAESNICPSQQQLGGYCPGSSCGYISPESMQLGDCGFGLAQWSAVNRKKGLFDKAKNENKPASDMILQLEYTWYELEKNVTGHNALQNLKKSNEPGNAAYIFHRDFEISADSEEEVIANRGGGAKAIYKNIVCDGSSSSSSTTTTTTTSSSGKNNINIPYYNQCDTKYATAANDLCGNGCGKTSVAMIATYISKKTVTPNQIATYSLESELATLTGKPTKADKIALTDKAEDITKKIEQQINKGNPVIIGTGFSTGYGHIMVVRGYDGSNYKINDPAGDHGNIWTTAYSSNNGNNVSYNKSDVVKHLTEYPYTYLNQGSWLLYVDGFTGPTNGGKQCLEGESTKYPGYCNEDVKKCEEILSQQQSSNGDNSCTGKAVEFVMKQIGKCYCSAREGGGWYGGTSGGLCAQLGGSSLCIPGSNIGDINHGSFDCAGLVGSAWSYAIYGKCDTSKICHSFVPNFESFGEVNVIKTSNILNDIKPGDAVYGGTYYGTLAPNTDYGHIGMYVGAVTHNGKQYKHAVVEAMGGEYGVVINEFEDRNWTKNLFSRPKQCQGSSQCTQGQLKDKIQKIIDSNQDKLGGKVGIYVKDNQKNETTEINSNQTMKTASTIKAGIMLNYLDKNGIPSGDDKNKIHEMIYHSDNASANSLIDKLGGFNKVSSYFQSKNLNNTKIGRYFDPPNKNAPDTNLSTPKEMASMFETIDQLPSDKRNYAIKELKDHDADSNSDIPSSLSSKIAHKIGSLNAPTYPEWVDNSGGIIFINDNHKIYYSIMTQGNKKGYSEVEPAVIAKIVQTIYDHYNCQ